MNFFLADYNKRLSLRLIFFIAVIFLAVNSYGAVLNPFPKPERMPVYKQVEPRYQVRQISPELEQFRHDITRFPCSDLDNLYERIQQQFNEAGTVEDRQYYRNFLTALDDERSRRCNN
jgi:hypothetical protein